MSHDRVSKCGRCAALQCVRAALTQGFALDAVLLVGLLIAALLHRDGWTTVYTIIVGTGVGKTVIASVGAAVRCAALSRSGPPPDKL